MGGEKRDFDKDAPSWDEDPGRVKLTKDIADALIGTIDLSREWDVLDFGCGTGLLTLRLQPFVRSILGADSSQGMLNVLEVKVQKQNLSNVRTQFLDSGNQDDLEGIYHLIVSSMTLHHVQDIRPLLARFHHVLAPNGILCIADLDSDEGKFHKDNTGVFHSGFDRSALSQDFLDAGFEEVHVTTAAEVLRPTADGGNRSFTIFLMTGKK